MVEASACQYQGGELRHGEQRHPEKLWIDERGGRWPTSE